MSAWPADASLPGAGERVVVVDLRAVAADGPDELGERLGDVTRFLVGAFARLRPADGPAALVIRHRPAASGRMSASLLGELCVSGSRSFLREPRYDRSWIDTPVVFVTGGTATTASSRR